MGNIPTITPEEACQRLRAMGVQISPSVIRDGLRQGVFPFGNAVKSEKGCRFLIWEVLFDAWLKERTAKAA